MNSYQKIMARIEAGEKIIIDGATGTELERHGVHSWKMLGMVVGHYHTLKF